MAKAAVPYLLPTLDGLNYNLMVSAKVYVYREEIFFVLCYIHQDICIWTIGNLAAGSDKAFEIIYAQGCLRRLISLMEECDLSLLPSVTYATMHCVFVGFKHME